MGSFLLWSKRRAEKVGLESSFNLHKDGLLGSCIQNPAAQKLLVAALNEQLSLGLVRPLLSLTQGPALFRVSFFFPHSSTQQTHTKALLSPRFQGFKTCNAQFLPLINVT